MLKQLLSEAAALTADVLGECCIYNKTKPLKLYINRNVTGANEFGFVVTLPYEVTIPIALLPYPKSGDHLVDDEGNQYLLGELKTKTQSKYVFELINT